MVNLYHINDSMIESSSTQAMESAANGKKQSRKKFIFLMFNFSKS